LKFATYILILLILSSCQEKQEKVSGAIYFSRAIEAEHYIKSAAIDTEFGKAWKVMPDSSNSREDLSLYSGTPGVVLFYLELFHSTGDSTYLNEAEQGADFLVNANKDAHPTAYELGLYTGQAGIGYVLTEMYKATNREEYKAGVLHSFNILKQSADTTEHGITWGNINDIVFGSSGIGLYLLYLSDELDLPAADSLAINAADGLLDLIDQNDGKFHWRMMPDEERYMENFSHGTAGIAYYLSEVYAKTRKSRFLEAALNAANYLQTITNDEGLIYHHTPGGENLYYMSWCHGPGGTSRLYYSLWKNTRNNKWLDNMNKSAKGVVNSGIDEHQTRGYWNNVSKCCGDAGVAEYFLWLYNITNNNDYLKYAELFTQKMLSASTESGQGIKWVQAENRVSPDKVAAQTGLMQGSSGMGLWLLELNDQLHDRKPMIVLPDKR